MDDNNRKDEEIQLSTIPLQTKIVMQELEKGHLVAIRSKNDFLYILEDGTRYKLFTHTVGEKEAGKRVSDKNENSPTMIDGMVRVAEAAYAAEYGNMNVYGVMAAMEDAILTRFPVVETEEPEENKDGKDKK